MTAREKTMITKTNLTRNVFIALLAIITPFTVMADVRLSALFADNMVIQRETQTPVWGTADAGEKVTVAGSWGASATTSTDAAGKWIVKLKTPEAGGPHTLTIKGNNTVVIKNVLSGEVWFCSGQSNMAFELKRLAKTNNHRTENKYKPAAAHIKKEMETAQDGMLRQFAVKGNVSWQGQVETLSGQWVSSSPKTNPDFSGTAYFFGSELRRELDVPIGLILCAWGATRIEPWIPEEAYQQDKEMTAYYKNSMAVTEEQVEIMKKSKRAWAPLRPSTIFNGIVHPVIPYAIKGMIWYQGEANAGHNPHRYGCNLRALISSWRAHWGQGDFPFYFAQLANYASPKASSDGWPTVQDQQRRTLQLKNTGMAVLSDIGEPRDVHPHNKMDVGKRLALWALKNDYKQNLSACSGPLYQSHTINGDKVIVKFDSTGSGLMSGEKPVMDATLEKKEPLTYFEICGAGRHWKPAQAEISGNDTVTVSSPEVPKPTAVRYAWSKNPEGANLYNKEGLPASLFTTETELPEPAAEVKASSAYEKYLSRENSAQAEKNERNEE